MKSGLKRFQEIFLYSDSEPNEVLIGVCCLEFNTSNKRRVWKS